MFGSDRQVFRVPTNVHAYIKIRIYEHQKR